MRPTLRLCLAAALALTVAPTLAAETPRRTLAHFESEAELRDWLDKLKKRAEPPTRAKGALGMADSAGMAQSAPASAPASVAAEQSKTEESITNVQAAGVDEGGIVKVHGDHLVVLRRGRLFTVSIKGTELASVSMADAFGAGIDPRGAWYDEMLIRGDTIIVIGFSYQRGGTEVGLFDIDRAGALSHRATYHLRSNDYYSSRNYASRLIGHQLVFYTPTILQPGSARPWETMPGLRRWRGVATPPDFERILPATRIYRSDDDFDPGEVLALHTVTSCDLAAPQLHCESSAVLGPAGRVFYVSQASVYVWTSAWRRAAWPMRPLPAPSRERSAVFRIPLGGAAPSALKTAGVPVDQLSFLEDTSGHLNVLLADDGAGEGMWGSERARGAMALLRVPLAAFGDGSASAQREHYRHLPAAGGAVQNRFVGDWLLWGAAPSQAWALRYADTAAAAQPLAPGHAIERIEAMGRDALLVGNDGSDLHLTSVRLQGRRAELASGHVQGGARQGETRTHGFFFRPTSEDEGVLGLPVLETGQPGGRGIYRGGQGSASVLFLRQRELRFAPLGQLRARPESVRDDACRASCVDWYGNARPIFLGERVFALLGYEIVEGQFTNQRWDERIEERRRISFAPNTAWREGRYSPFN